MIGRLKGETPGQSAKRLGMWAQDVDRVRSRAARPLGAPGTIPGVISEARARLGIPAPEDLPVPPVVLELGRVHRGGELAESVAVDPLLFWSQVDRSAGPSKCWPWTGPGHEDGYGIFKSYTAMRIAWALVNGPIPPGLLVRHYVCNNPPCCNVAHLRLGTHDDNMTDRIVAKLRADGRI